MLGLVADIGGTNTRLALAERGRVDAKSILRFANDDHAGFSDLMQGFLDQHGVQNVEAAAIAVAGPVSFTGAQLTNRDWRIDAGMLEPVTGRGPVRFLNDLKALGYALPVMGSDALEMICPGHPDRSGNGQSLVVGIGTGFNTSPVLVENGVTTCMDTEYGHTALPGRVASLLRNIGTRFETVEHCFSGRGYAGLRDVVGAEKINLHYAGLMAAMARELVMAFMPLDGIYFAGSVARAVLQSPDRTHFVDGFIKPFFLRDDLSAIPVGLITDDFAPLTGCAQVLRKLERS